MFRVSPIVVAAMALIVVVGIPIRGEDEDRPILTVRTVFDAPAPVAGAVYGSGTPFHAGDRICTTLTQTATNVDTSCEKSGPTNETSIAVNPIDERNMIGGGNDYQLGLNPGGYLTMSIYSRAHVTFDGGQTWAEYPIRFDSAYQGTGDPAVAFDGAGRAYYATLGGRYVGPTNRLSADVLVAHSEDGGRTWRSARVATGTGLLFDSSGHFLDKEYVAAWGNGNAIVTWGDFQFGPRGVAVNAKIYSSVTHDGGNTWSVPSLISGDLEFSYLSTPTVAADGRLYVAFIDASDPLTFRGNYQMVEVSGSTGARIFGPAKVASLVDGPDDYPGGLFGRKTYQDSLFRTWAGGNIVADGTNASHLAVIWSDMRNSPNPAPLDPYGATTNSDVVVSQSFDRGRTWSAPVALMLPGDQFMPWGAYDKDGRMRIGFYDRQYDIANHQYGYTLATEISPTALAFDTTQITTMLSDPTMGARWFAYSVNPLFPFATAFMGDYSNIAAVPSGGIVAYWTDMRQQACFGTRCGHGEDAFFAREP
jgi:hypothetical protein